VRFVIFGAGAIGGVVGARLHQAGHEVHLIARGAHREAIAARGLTLQTPEEEVTLPIPVSATPADVGLRADDIVLLAVKGQDTAGALDALRCARPAGLPVVCLQNGVENERLARRLFGDVYGAVVMSPTSHLQPGVVQAYATRVTGAIDIGRYPSGVDGRCEAVCAALRAARFESTPREDVMRLKYAKLLTNLGNAVEAICGERDAGVDGLASRAEEEGRAVLQAAGIDFAADYVSDVLGRWRRWGVGQIAGHARAGGSTWQSATRGSSRLETDYLNGEIVLLGALTGHPTPVNHLLQELGAETARDGHSPGWLSAGDVLERL
jgi:2-dehydropantoate 2-reductase